MNDVISNVMVLDFCLPLPVLSPNVLTLNIWEFCFLTLFSPHFFHLVDYSFHYLVIANFVNTPLWFLVCCQMLFILCCWAYCCSLCFAYYRCKGTSVVGTVCQQDHWNNLDRLRWRLYWRWAMAQLSQPLQRYAVCSCSRLPCVSWFLAFPVCFFKMTGCFVGFRLLSDNFLFSPHSLPVHSTLDFGL